MYPTVKALLIWFGLFIGAAICTGVGIGVGANLNKAHDVNENKEMLNWIFTSNFFF